MEPNTLIPVHARSIAEPTLASSNGERDNGEMNRLRLSGIDRGDDCELVVFLDGDDVLHHLDAIGVEPDVAFPLLVPVSPPRRVQLGRCGCGDDRCGSVTVRIAADGNTVVWDGWSSTLGDGLPGAFRFDRSAYDAAVSAANQVRPWESKERRFARRAAELVDADVRAALSWRGLQFVAIEPAGEAAVAVHLSARYCEARWAVFVVVPVGGDPGSIPHLLSHWGPTAWPNVVWWSENEAAAFQQPPMAGRRWHMWQPVDV